MGGHDRHSRALPVAVTAVTIAGLCLVAGMGAAAASTATTSSTATASAASSAHWRIVARTDNALTTIVAPTATSAWALGEKAGPSSGTLPAGVRWNGHRWSSVTFPKAVKSGIACVGASSPGNVWAFAGMGLFASPARFSGALRLSGGKWILKRSFTPAGLVSGCSVLSPANIWLYGSTHAAQGVGTWRLRGSTWRAAKTGAFSLISASKVNDRDMWALATSTLGSDDIVAHWNGTSWRRDSAFAAAMPAESSTLNWLVTAINAVGAGNVWVAGQIRRENSTGNWTASPIVLHLANGKWSKVRSSNPGYYMPGAVSDGHGGWWSNGPVREFGVAVPAARPYLLHKSGGHWMRVSLPAVKGYQLSVDPIVRVPGSRTMLAIGSLYNGKAILRSVVLAYGPLPR